MSDTPPPGRAPASRDPSPAAAPARRSRLGCLLLSIVVLFPVSLCVPLLFAGGGPSIDDNTILELDLQHPLREESDDFALLSTSQPQTLRDFVMTLDEAARDPRVRGLFARVGGSAGGMGVAQEVRDAILAFRRSGKPAVVFAETIGEGAPGVGGWYVATAFDEIWLQPQGEVALSGLSAEAPFIRGALDKLGVQMHVEARKEFKNAPDIFVETGFTDAHRTATRALLDGWTRQIVDGALAARPSLGDAGSVRAALVGGPWNDEESLQRHLVDHVGYRDDALHALRERAGGVGKLLWWHRYRERAQQKSAKGDVVAVVTASGQIMRGTSSVDPLSGSRTLGSDTVAAALRGAVDDRDVRAILLRIDSPGGSVVASESIWHEVERAKKAGKKVVASMGNTAASGGYYIAAGADAIVAQPGTITGSIGVYTMKPVTTKMWEQLGVNFDTVAVEGADPSLYSTDIELSDAARARMSAFVDRIYDSFVHKVADGRRRPFEQVEPHAHGRVWTGADAMERGLVDELGGLPVALAQVRKLLQLPDGAPLQLRAYPREQPMLEQVLHLLRGDDGDNSDDAGDARATAMRPTWQGLVHVAARAAADASADAPLLRAPALPELP